MKMHFVYHLVDPADRKVRYIGKTTRPKARLAQHIAEAKKSQSTRKKAWVKSLLDKNMAPVMVVVGAYCTESEGRKKESEECKAHIRDIFNIHDPAKGAGDIKLRDGTRRKPKKKSGGEK